MGRLELSALSLLDRRGSVDALEQRLAQPARCFEFEGVRNQALIKVMHAQPPGSLIYGGNSNDAAGYGGPCEGDSGSPVFRDGEIIGLYTNSLRHCTNWGAGPSSRRWPGTGLPPLARSGALILRAASIVRA
jgi:hypothetical protein